MERGAVSTSRDEVRAVVCRSFLRSVDSCVIDEMLSMAIVHHVRAGTYVRDAGDPWLGIVVTGLARAFVWTADGRQVPLRHLRSADAFGVAASLGRSDPIAVKAVRDSRILALEATTVHLVAQSEIRLATAIAGELSADLDHMAIALKLATRNAIRDRLAGILLAMSGDGDGDGPDGTAEPILVSHEDLAEAVGTAREVVTRHLHLLQREGMVRLGRGSVTLTCPGRLRETAHLAPPVTQLAS